MVLIPEESQHFVGFFPARAGLLNSAFPHTVAVRQAVGQRFMHANHYALDLVLWVRVAGVLFQYAFQPVQFRGQEAV